MSLTTKEKIIIINQIPIENIISSYGVETETNNRIKNRSCCPICGGDNKTEFVWNNEKNYFYCFKCNSSGGPLDFVMQILGLEKSNFADLLIAIEDINNRFCLWNQEEITEDQRKKINEITKRNKKAMQKAKRKKAEIDFLEQKAKELSELRKKFERLLGELFCLDNVDMKLVRERNLQYCMCIQKQNIVEDLILEKMRKKGEFPID